MPINIGSFPTSPWAFHALVRARGLPPKIWSSLNGNRITGHPSQGATHAKATRTGPDRLDPPRDPGRPPGRIEHQPSMPQGRHRPDDLLPLEGPPGGPSIERATPHIRTRG